MKQVVFILFMGSFLLTYGCNTMKAVEDDMSSLLEHMEIDSLSSKTEKNVNQTDGRNASADQTSSQSFENGNQSKNINHSLTIQAFPEDSTVKVMNIRSRYYPGMRLATGKYDILVEHDGYKSYREWVNVNYDMMVKVILKEEQQAYMSTSVDSVDKPDAAGTEFAEEKAGFRSDSSAALEFPARLSGHYGSVSSLCFSPDSRLLASGSYDSNVIIWKIADGSVVYHLNHGDRVTAVAFSPNGEIVLSAGSDDLIKLWDVASGKLLQTLKGHSSRIHSAVFDLTGKTIVSGANNELIIWEASTGKIQNLIVGDDKLYPRFGSIKTIAFNPAGADTEGYKFAFTCLHGIALFNPETKALMKLEDTATPNSVTYSPDGQYIAWGARHHHHKTEFFPRFVRVDTRLRDPLLSKDDALAKADRVFYTGFTPDGSYLVMLTYNQAVLYDVKAGTVIKNFKGTSETAVTDAALSLDGHLLAASSKDTIKIWKID